MPEYGWRTWEVRWRNLVAKGQGMASTCGGRVPHGPASSLAACGTRAPNVGRLLWSSFFVDKNALLPILFKSLQFHPVSLQEEKVKARLWCSPNFSQLPNTITFSYGVGIEWFKLEIVRIRVLYLFQVVLQLFDWFSEWSTQKTEPAREIKVVFIS